jgi:hypothetical protein
MFLTGVLTKSTKISFLIERDHSVDLQTEWEKEFFAGATFFRKTGSSNNFGQSLSRVIQQANSDWVVISRNPKLMLDANLLKKIENVVSEATQNELLITPAGLSLDNEVVSTIYSSDEPSMRRGFQKTPVVDTSIDLYLLNLEILADLNWKQIVGNSEAFEPMIMLEGWKNGYFSCYVPDLSCGVYGGLRCRDGAKLIFEWKNSDLENLKKNGIRTLVGEVNLADEFEVVDYHEFYNKVYESTEFPSISLVIRTQFTRPELLRRLLISIERSFADNGISYECVLSTDVASSKSFIEYEKLQKEFSGINVRLLSNQSEATDNSRVNNLVCGLEAASNDYVWIVDDDDFLSLDAIDNLRKAFCFGNRPMIFTSCDVLNETWEVSSSGKSVLVNASVQSSFPSSRWVTLFSGVNSIPVCGFLAPRRNVVERLKLFEFRFDLSEDYVLLLMLMTDPALPPIFEVKDVLVNISVRNDGDNVVTMDDRSRWVMDITGFLSDLYSTGDVSSDGHWQLLSSLYQGFGYQEKFFQNLCDQHMDNLQKKESELQRLREVNEILRRKYSQLELQLLEPLAIEEKRKAAA